MSSKGHKVFISEYAATPRWKLICGDVLHDKYGKLITERLYTI